MWAERRTSTAILEKEVYEPSESWLAAVMVRCSVCGATHGVRKDKTADERSSLPVWVVEALEHHVPMSRRFATCSVFSAVAGVTNG